MLHKNFFSAEQLTAIVMDYQNAGLEPDEVAIMAFAEKVILDQHSITQDDVNRLNAHGLTDEEVLDVVLAAAARSFYTKVLDALGAEPDEAYFDSQPELRAALLKGMSDRKA